MTTPEVLRCFDGHFRRIIYSLGPYIADYPEQALLACIVQGWCPRYVVMVLSSGYCKFDWFCSCTAKDLAVGGGRRSREHTEALVSQLELGALWDEYGLVGDLVVCNDLVGSFVQPDCDALQPFTNDFPRADIHELIAPDLLHQLIKGTFKDHLVSWVCEYLIKTHGETRANRILDDIDKRYD